MVNWSQVADKLQEYARPKTANLDVGQRASVAELAERIRAGRRAMLLADEVGMGKTRIAVALIEAVRQAGGRAAIVLPAGLGVQWQKELRLFNPDDKTLLPLRSYDSFIAGFMHDDDDDRGGIRGEKHKERLRDRRQQRELPEKGWAAEKVLMISHMLAAMRFPTRDDEPAVGWRRELLPHVAKLVAGSSRNIAPDSFYGSELPKVRATRRAAEEIAGIIDSRKLPCNLKGNQKWLSADDYKGKILPLIGYGLGEFDLIVVDEAHKARGEDSSLSRILGPVTWESDDPFRLGMTATPVELNAKQWIETLARVTGRDDGANTDELNEMTGAIEGYVDIVKRLQREELDEELTRSFESAAADFANALRPYVLRRDKRHDPQYSNFRAEHGDYRVIEDLTVSPNGVGYDRNWLRRFCAAEALSLQPQDDPRVKRSRLSVSMGFGWGFATDEDADLPEVQENWDKQSIWLQAAKGTETDIYTHPAILEAVQLIEEYAAKGEKVLVFGRFIKPMKALTQLLDAREILRRLRDDIQHWPASKLHDYIIPAMNVAMQDPELVAPDGGIHAISEMLKERYDNWEASRKKMLAQHRRQFDELAGGDKDAKLLTDLLGPSDDENLNADTGALLEALEAREDMRSNPITGPKILDAFKSLLSELVGDDEKDDDETLKSRLDFYLSDYSGREGNFARMMSGNTAPQTRRVLQASFNRRSSWPMVLIAQSQVGREGLNLHEACRTVVLLHSEWNPGIVEQQIGRVDRKNSRWLSDLASWEANGRNECAPRIHIRPVIVSGSYDDYNWQVLKSRWSELRAQLHGDVLPCLDSCPVAETEKHEWQRRVKEATPSFAPPKLGS